MSQPTKDSAECNFGNGMKSMLQCLRCRRWVEAASPLGGVELG